MYDYYAEAQRKGQKEFRGCVSRGEHPYLPRLDDFISTDRFSNGADLGVIQVPAELIVGTRTSGRTNAFSRSFLPLLDQQSEFAAKWRALCEAHLEEGIRDPIKAYEYMNRFYVEEGNKRVSVLKFFDAVSVAAEVTRILPERNGSKEVELYYEFLDFYRVSKLNLLEFSKPGSYAAFQRLMGKRPGDPWTEDDRRDFTAAYYYFRQAYEANRGGSLTSTVGDAMLAYVKIYGFEDLRKKTGPELKKQLAKVWEEIILQQEELPISVKLTPEEDKEKEAGLLSKVLPKAAPKKLRAAFIHDKTPADSGWTYGHELGRQHAAQVLGEELETTAYFNAMDSDPQGVIDQAIADGNTVIFTTSPRLLPASLRAAVDHPEVTILNCSLNKSHRYIRTYYSRMYEAKFIMGAVAGSLAGGNNVGFICDYPIFGQVAGINAFALGVQMTNPRSKVFLDWSAVGGIQEATKRLTDRGICLISCLDLPKQGEKDPRFGLSLLTGDSQVNLAMPMWRWGAYYEAILRQIRDKTFQSEYKESSKALNYYWGMSAGVISLYCSDKLPDSSRKLAAVLKSGICAGTCNPFQGPLFAQGGRTIARSSESLAPEQIINMDWLAENISGSIPAYQELTQTGKETVSIVGVDSSEAEPGGPII